MSQEKVARYKEEKANRKSIMRKQKITKAIGNTVAAVILVAVVGWLGYSGVTYYLDNRPVPSVEVDYTALTDYETSLTTDETEDAETTEDTETTDEAADETGTTEETAE